MIARGYTPAVSIALSAVSFREGATFQAFFTPQDRGDWWQIDYFAPWPKPDEGYLLNMQQSRASQLLGGLQDYCEKAGGSHDHIFEKLGPVHVRTELVCQKEGRVIFFAKLAPSKPSFFQGGQLSVTAYRMGVVELKSFQTTSGTRYPTGYREAIRAMGGGAFL